MSCARPGQCPGIVMEEMEMSQGEWLIIGDDSVMKTISCLLKVIVCERDTTDSYGRYSFMEKSLENLIQLKY